MASTGSKKSLPWKVAAMKARKREKLSGKPARIEKSQPRRTVQRVESLKWERFKMPDHMDDYEGFAGLDEVEGVDVVRDPESGHVSFAVAEYSAVSLSGHGNASSDIVHEEDIERDDEWTGFNEEMDVTGEAGAHSITSQPPDKKVKSVNGASTLVKAQTQRAPQSTEAFKSLLDEDEEQAVDTSAWSGLALKPDTLAALSKLRFAKPTPIQEATIPEIHSGRDVIGKASTGSGKTLAFGIPILETYLEDEEKTSQSTRDERWPLALILSPTRELAHQLEKHLTELCASGIFRSPTIATLTGGLAVQKQWRLLHTAHVVIGTPGRLWEVMSQSQETMDALRKIKFLVVDEADRLLSEGHFKEVEEILNALDRHEDREDEQDDGMDSNNGSSSARNSSNELVSRQTLVFSATFDRSLQRNLAARKFKPDSNLIDKKDTLAWLLSKLNFREEAPKFIDVNPVNQLAEGLKEGLIECGGSEKDLYLYTLLLLHPNTRTLVFANSVNAVRRLTPLLQTLNLPALALHSGMPQKARLRSVERLKDGSGSILVATDVAARGLDIPQVQVVIHYHLPRAADMYVHRSGRTARAGLSGSSILICAPEEVGGVRKLVAKVHASSLGIGDGIGGRKGGYYIRTIEIDRKIVTRLKPRATLAKKIADASIAKEKRSKENDFMRAAAEELGVDYDSEEFEAEGSKGRRGRGSGRKKKERDAAGLSKGEIGVLKAELKELLRQRVNVGVSEKYLTSGRVDVDELLRQQEAGAGREFLGDTHDGLLD